jgi:integrase/recombinase XerD
MLVYRRTLTDSQPAQRRVMTGRKMARADPHWRPFPGSLLPASERQAFVIQNALFAWLVNAGYLGVDFNFLPDMGRMNGNWSVEGTIVTS